MTIAGPVYYVAWLAASLASIVLAVLHRDVARRWAANLRPSVAIFGGFALAVVVVSLAATPTGDEPHYLIIAQSIVRDGDLDLRNNYESLQYLDYYPRPISDPHVNAVGGRWYSSHGPALGFIAAPWFALAGRPGVVVMLALITIAGVRVLWSLLEQVGLSLADVRAATLVGALTLPLVSLAGQVYPEVPAFLLVALALYAVFAPSPGPREVAVLLVSLAVLPWFHPKYAAVDVAIVVAAIARRRADLPGRYVAIAAASTVATLIAFAAFHSITGIPLPGPAPVRLGQVTASGGLDAAAAMVSGMAFGTSTVGLTGSLLDQQSGLLFASPVYALSIAGTILWWRRRRDIAIGCAAVFLSVYLPVGIYSVWYGGFDSPARFLTPAVPVLVVGLAGALQWGGRLAYRLFILLAIPSFLHAYLITTLPSYVRYGDTASHHNYFIAQLERLLNVDLTPLYPSFRNPGQAAAVTVLLYVVAISSITALIVIGRSSNRLRTVEPV